jgi:hypothetical protein
MADKPMKREMSRAAIVSRLFMFQGIIPQSCFRVYKKLIFPQDK